MSVSFKYILVCLNQYIDAGKRNRHWHWQNQGLWNLQKKYKISFLGGPTTPTYSMSGLSGGIKCGDHCNFFSSPLQPLSLSRIWLVHVTEYTSKCWSIVRWLNFKHKPSFIFWFNKGFHQKKYFCDLRSRKDFQAFPLYMQMLSHWTLQLCQGGFSSEIPNNIP